MHIRECSCKLTGWSFQQVPVWQLREGAAKLKMKNDYNDEIDLPLCTPETVGLAIAAQQRKVSKSGRDLKGVDLSGIDFRGLDFRACNFEKANLAGANLDGCDLRETNMKNAIFSTGFLAPTLGEGVELQRWEHAQTAWKQWENRTNGQRPTEVASMQGVLLGGADLSQAVLQGVNMSRVDGQKTDAFKAVCLVKAHLQGVILM